MCAQPSDSELKGKESAGFASVFLLEPVREYLEQVERESRLVGFYMWRRMDQLGWRPDQLRAWLGITREQWWPLFLSMRPTTHGHMLMLAATYTVALEKLDELLYTEAESEQLAAAYARFRRGVVGE